ncbi:hypothetical protein HPB47_019142 [Ixodes persulcatus]|uniref:Uncharacterized protein n=1 Tax=Ixodes persulcatus TaxID=34615 RepID=A0AC60QJ04_IXOPE|nr:hypothetical protein HPB47_019142 [Ixodes persulcatus]
MSIKTRSQAAKEDDPLIQCAKCGRWAYILTETEFKTAKEAEGDIFVCRLCQTIEEQAKSHQKEIEKLEQSFNERFKHLEDAVKTSAPAPNDENHTLKDCVAELLHRLQTSNSFPEQADPDELIRPPSGVHREVIVAGDSNVALFARALSEEGSVHEGTNDQDGLYTTGKTRTKHH